MPKPEPLGSLEQLTAEQDALIEKIRSKTPLTLRERQRMEIVEELLLMHRGQARQRRLVERLRQQSSTP